MGKLTVITTTFALIADFLLLPTVLMKLAPSKEEEVEAVEEDRFITGNIEGQTA